MIFAQRQRRRASTMVASLAVAAGLAAGIASPAGAASEAEFLGANAGKSQDVEGTIDGHDRTLRAGLFDLMIDGDVESHAYCIDINTPIHNGAMLDEVDWATSGVANLDKVEAILRHYYPNGVGPAAHQITGSDKDKASATQAAIWHYTDGFDLTDGGENSQTVMDNYKAILAAVEGGLEGFGQPTVTLTITPPGSTEGTAGELVGPYIVNTSAESATLTPSDGVTLHNEDGSPFTGAIVDGTQLWLSSDAEGDGTITATAQAEVGAGRVFFTQGQQRLVLASTVTTEGSAEAEVSFQAAPTHETTTTTAPEETTTTLPPTSQTTVVTETPTTTVPAVPASNRGGGLPVTGAQSLVLVGIAVVLLAIGAGFRIVSHRNNRLDS